MRNHTLLALAVLASCATTQQMYEGEERGREEVALVVTEGPTVLGAAFRGAVSPVYSAKTPDSIRIEAVDGREAGAMRVVVLPGEHTLRLRGVRAGAALYAEASAEGELTFVAEAGTTYTITAEPSEHAPPWAYLVRVKNGQEVLATSEPRRADLDLARVPLDASWELAGWILVDSRHQESFVPRGEELEHWTRLVELQSGSLSETQGDIDLATSAERSAAARRKAGAEVELVVGPDHWIERWRSTRSSSPQWGVTVTHVRGGTAYALVYASRAKEVDEAERRGWEERFLGAEVPQGR